jgi:prepilin-type processing-associated H-X9-DG protein
MAMLITPTLARRQRSGLSIADVVVAIAAAVLLGAVAISHAQGIGGAASHTACLKQIGQLGTAFAAYANENKGRYPRSAPRIVAKFEKLTQPQDEDWIYWQTLPQPRDVTKSPIAAHLGREAKEFFRCSADDGDGRVVKNEEQGQYGYSYVMNEYMSPFPLRRKPEEVARSVSQIANPTEKVLLYEQDVRSIDDGGGDPDVKAGELLSIRHNNGGITKDVTPAGGPLANPDRNGTVLFVDGHAELVSRRFVHDPKHFLPK